MNLATLPVPGRRFAARIYHHIVPRKHHSDIRAYAAFAKDHGLEHIHYGYWHPGDDVKTAQDQLYREVRALIPFGVVNVLDVGGGIGGTSARLVADGYRPLCIVPDSKLIAQGQECFPQVPFIESTAEGFRVGDKFDAALFLESYQYFSQKGKALANIVGHLTSQAAVIFAEEFSLGDNDSLPKENLLMSYMRSNGYILACRIDVSKRILPTCRFVYETLEQIQPPLAEGKQLAEVWRNNEAEYLARTRQYLLLRFKREERKAACDES